METNTENILLIERDKNSDCALDENISMDQSKAEIDQSKPEAFLGLSKHDNSMNQSKPESGMNQSKPEASMNIHLSKIRSASEEDKSKTESMLHDSRSGSSLGYAPKIDDFQLLKPISRGAFGKVFLCHRRDQPNKKLAVKVSLFSCVDNIPGIS